MKHLRSLIPMLLLLVAAAELPADIEELRQKALSEDINTSRAALKALAAKGAAHKPLVHEIARELLTRDKAKIQENAALLADTVKYKATDEKLAALRKSARENLTKLAKDETLTNAQQNYDALSALLAESAAPLRSQIFDAVKRRPELLALWRQTPTSPAENPFAPAEEAKLVSQAEKALGMTIAAASALSPANPRNEPKEPAKFNFWLYRACRQVEAYNDTFKDLMDREELANIKATNTYRELLGLMPLEVDPRLVQSARRHSREMVELKFFSHKSPTSTNQSFEMRFRNAGYPHGGGENIATGPMAGAEAFKIWFDSPPHHINMLRQNATQIGVGRWKNFWTQNFGLGPRLMFASEAERNRLAVRGEILKPDLAITAPEERRGLPGLPLDLIQQRDLDE